MATTQYEVSGKTIGGVALPRSQIPTNVVVALMQRTIVETRVLSKVLKRFKKLCEVYAKFV